MTLALIVVVLLLAPFLVLVSFVQLLYLEALRLRARESPALDFFKESLEDRLGLKPEQGALAFSLIKHSSLLFLLAVLIGLVDRTATPLWQTLLEGLVSGWLLMVVLTYLSPQLLYKRTGGRWLQRLTPVVRVLILLVKPVLGVMAFLRSIADLGDAAEGTQENGRPTEEFEALISAGAEEGLIEEDDRKLIESVVAFGDKTVREVMTPRPNVVAVPLDASLEDLRTLVIDEQYSRIPVFDGSIDQIVGFVHVRDMFELDAKERVNRHVNELMRPIDAVPETKPVNDLLREMQQRGAHMVVVVDEYGNTAGLATMEDLVEEIVGEIRDEHEPTQDVTPDSNGGYVVSGSFDLDRLNDLLEFRPHEETESTTVGGLVTEWLGHVPRAGEAVERDGIRIEVISCNERRVAQVRISRTNHTANAAERE